MLKRNKSLNTLFLSIIFIIYLILMCKILFFKYVTISEIFSNERELIRTVNLIPFYSILKYHNGVGLKNPIAFLNVFGNILIFIPYGVFLEMFKYKFKFNSKKVFSMIFITSLAIEAIQFLLGIGISDVDDIILNTVGGFIGIVSYKLLFYLFKDKEKIKEIIVFIAFSLVILYLILILIANMMGIRIKLL